MTRVPVPPDVAANALFAADRTCCVCRDRGKRVQIHHLDEDHANSVADNLAVLCFDCHDQTQLRGGFGRRLDAHQVKQYRDDWESRVRQRRDEADRLATDVMAGGRRDVSSTDTLRISIVEAANVVDECVTARVSVEQDTSWAYDNLVHYVTTLPELRRRAYSEARSEWDSGVTSRMVDASYRVIDVLQDILAHLAKFYPEGHFEREHPRDYIAEIVATRFRWHRYRHEPDGAGRNGTIVQTLVAGSVTADLEQMVFEMVEALTLDWSSENQADFNLDVWKGSWFGRIG